VSRHASFSRLSPLDHPARPDAIARRLDGASGIPSSRMFTGTETRRHMPRLKSKELHFRLASEQGGSHPFPQHGQHGSQRWRVHSARYAQPLAGTDVQLKWCSLPARRSSGRHQRLTAQSFLPPVKRLLGYTVFGTESAYLLAAPGLLMNQIPPKLPSRTAPLPISACCHELHYPAVLAHWPEGFTGRLPTKRYQLFPFSTG
jgi:hypothetical protein